MMQTIMKQYIKMAEFIALVFGPDYEIALHNATPPDYPIIAIANRNISGRSIGDPLSGAAREAITGKIHEQQDSLYIYDDILAADGLPLRSSCQFIKDDAGKLIGIFCISFDDYRYRNFSEQLMKLCHPNVYVDSNFICNKDFLLQRKATGENGKSIQEIISLETRKAIHEVIGSEDISVERLTMDEKMQIITILKENGSFHMKNAARLISAELACSTASIYRYLSKLPRD